MKKLIKNLKQVDLISDKKGANLDLDNATPFEINIFLGYLLGRISAYDICNPKQYAIQDCGLRIGETIVVPDYYNNHVEAHLLLTKYNIATVFDDDANVYRACKMTIESGEMVVDGSYASAFNESNYINAAGLKTLIGVLSSKNIQKIYELDQALTAD